MTSFLKLLRVWLAAALLVFAPEALAQDTLLGGAGGYSVASVASSSTWDPATFPAGIVGGLGNTKATNNGAGDGHYSFWGTTALTGKPYFEIACTTCATDGSFGLVLEEFGVANASQANTDFLGHNVTSGGYRADGKIVFNFAIQSTDANCAVVTGGTMGVAMDVPNRKVWFTSNGTTWCGAPGSNDPATGTGGMDLSTVPVTGPFFPAATINTNNNALTLRTGGGFAFAIPTGFTAAL